jgi:hypothetical protein
MVNKLKTMYNCATLRICGWGGGYGYYSNHGFLIAFVTDGNNGEERPGIGFRFNWKNLNRLPELSTTEAGVTPKPITPIQGACELRLFENYSRIYPS